MKSLTQYIAEASNNGGEKLANVFIDHFSKIKIENDLVDGKFANMPAFKMTSESDDAMTKIFDVVKKNSRGCNTTNKDVTQMCIDKVDKTVIEMDGTGDITICNPSLDKGFMILSFPETDRDGEKSFVVWTKVNTANLKNHSDHADRHKKFYVLDGKYFDEIKDVFGVK